MSPLDLEVARLQGSFGAFVREAWAQVDSSPLDWSWYLQTLCDHAQATVIPAVLNSDALMRLRQRNPGAETQQGFRIENGAVRILRLLVNMPPRMGKSIILSGLFPAWVWTRDPQVRFLTTSYAADLSDRDSLATRQLLESPWYQERWPYLSLDPDEGAKSRYSVEAGSVDGGLVQASRVVSRLRGRRVATSVRARALGEGGHFRLVDDPNDTKQREGKKEREQARHHVFMVLPTRTAGRPEDAVTIIYQQRTHEEDVSGDAIKSGGYQHLCLPMEYDGVVRETVLGRYDIRREKGELLDPVRYPRSIVNGFKRDLGPYVFSGQFQQDPKPASGGFFTHDHVQFWTPAGADLGPVRDRKGREYRIRELPASMDELIQSWDCTLKGAAQAVRDGKLPDKTAGHVWGRWHVDCFLLDRVSDHMDLPAATQAVYDLTQRWPACGVKLIEGKANGPAIMANLRDRVSGMVEVTPVGSKADRVVDAASSRTAGDKDARALSMQALWAGGNIWLPHPSIAPWVWDLIEQFVGFPLMAEDDDVDASSQGLAWLGRHAIRHLERSRQEAKQEDDTRSAANPVEAQRRKIMEQMRRSMNEDRGRMGVDVLPW